MLCSSKLLVLTDEGQTVPNLLSGGKRFEQAEGEARTAPPKDPKKTGLKTKSHKPRTLELSGLLSKVTNLKIVSQTFHRH